MNLPTLNCEKCNHKWIPRVADPKKCPKCGHYQGTNVHKRG